MKTRLLILPGLALTIWLAGILFTTDLAVPVRDLRRFENVLIVFSHADDETMNCGGAIRRFSTAGATVTLLLLTGGERGNPEGIPDASLKAIRHREAEQVAGILGVSRLIQEDFGDGQLRYRREQVTSYLSREIGQINPDLILTHDLAGLDGHEDHVACSEIPTELKRTELSHVPLWYAAAAPTWARDRAVTDTREGDISRDHGRMLRPPKEAFDPRQEPSAVVPHAGVCAGGRPTDIVGKCGPYRDNKL